MSRDPENADIAHALYRALILDDKHKVRTVAQIVGRSPSTIYAWAENALPIPAWALPRLYRATNDLDLFATMIGAHECGLLVTRRGEATGGFKRPESITLAIASAAGNVAQLVADAQLDETISEAEAKAILAGLESLERRVVALRQKLKVVGAER